MVMLVEHPMLVPEQFLHDEENQDPHEYEKRGAEGRSTRSLALKNLRNKVDERVAQKRADRKANEKSRQRPNPRFVHGEGNEADKQNEAHRHDTSEGKDNWRHD